MNKLLPVLLLATLGAFGCCSTEPRAAVPAVHGKIVDLGEFESFVATHPSPVVFREHYPDVTLVLPGEMASKEFRRDHSRYFAELDASGRIVGGSFK
jgi:hypothetical protein